MTTRSRPALAAACHCFPTLVRSNSASRANSGHINCTLGGGSYEALLSPGIARPVPCTFSRLPIFQGAMNARDMGNNNVRMPLRAPQPGGGCTPLPALPRGPLPPQRMQQMRAQQALGFGPGNGNGGGGIVYESPYAPRPQPMAGPYPALAPSQMCQPPAALRIGGPPQFNSKTSQSQFEAR